MKKQINRNYIWSKLIVDFMQSAGVKDVCISPGSRNTPLVLAFAANKKIRRHVIVDERASGFFALGLSKTSASPVAIVTTSGTAVAELYPAIIEAYFQKIPLIICTADRPHYLRNSGANQTINQDNIYKNHIRYFADFGLPEINYKKLQKAKNNLASAFTLIDSEFVGPIHFNFPFEKPFEPSNTTDSVKSELLDKIRNDFVFNPSSSRKRATTDNNIFEIISSAQNVLILSGDSTDEKEKSYLIKIAKHLQSPIIAGILSPVRFVDSNYVIKNASTFLRNKSITKQIQPDLILQFGYAPTSNSILEFFSKSKAVKIAINNFNQKFDPSLTTKFVVKKSAENFYFSLLKSTEERKDGDYLQELKKIDTQTGILKDNYLSRLKDFFEWNAYTKLLEQIPLDSNIMISNSLPVRDFDFVANISKNIKVFSNRGASGIDGIISTAAGIFNATRKATYLVIGDLAFYYDLTSLFLLKKYKIPLKIILVNNNGGGIFELLPIADEKIDFQNYFKTPLDIDFEPIIKSFGGKYFYVENEKSFIKTLRTINKLSEFVVLEIKVNSTISKNLRQKFWNEINTSFAL
ncbi:MAG: 2-succinyl-5-enolpyruvyl-6-hydroxy-3-cyclohexene-1-carboxylic-acid synthase [Ignavibacteriales bacterium]